MSLEKFITDMLNIDSNNIERLDSINKPNNDVIVKVKLKRSCLVCPLCNNEIKIHGYYDRKLSHSTLMNRKCLIVYSQRRYYCKNCEYTFHENNPFINTKENITLETKINVLKDLKYPSSTYTAVARRNNISVTKCMNIFDNHVNIERKELPEILSIDEHYFPESSYDSLYMCVLMDFNTGIVIDVLPDRKKEYLRSYFTYIKAKTYNDIDHTNELNNVKYVSIDLYDVYRDIAHIYFPKALVCADSFHVLEHLTKDFRDVRLRCRRETEDEDMKYLLTKFKYIFNHDTILNNEPKYNKRFKRYLNHKDILDMMLNRFPKLKKAYVLKEKYILFNETCKKEDVKEELIELIKEFSKSDIKEYDEFYNLLINWFDEIINSFTIIKGKRINNSYIESRNRIIDNLIYNANGFTNFKRTRNRILYCINKEDTYKI